MFLTHGMCFSDPYLCVAIVRVPAGSEAVLSSDIPNQEVCLTHGDLLDVAANGWRCVDGFLRQTVCVGRWEQTNILNVTESRVQASRRFYLLVK